MRNAIYLVERDFGRLGVAYLETDPLVRSATDPKALAAEIARGAHDRILSIHLVDFAKGTVADVTSEILGEAEAMKEQIQ